MLKREKKGVNMVFIELTQGRVAIIDKKDEAEVRKYKWYYEKPSKPGYTGYAASKSGKHKIYLHRLILARKLGRELNGRKEISEHKNNNGLDCRRVNLRPGTHSLNGANRMPRADNPLGISGISLDKRNGRYIAYYFIKSKKKHLGSYKRLEDAVMARKAKEIELYGEYAYSASSDRRGRLV
jgi:hypothetical protein